MDLEKLKKSISMIAVGFVFTLVNINLKFGDTTVNVMPDFIGWLLYFLAFDGLGEYGKGKEYMKWAALPIMMMNIVQYAYTFINPEAELTILNTVTNLCEVVYLFLLLGIVEMIAEDIGSGQTERIHTVRYLIVAAELFILLFTIFMKKVGISEAVVVMTVAIVLFIVMILTMIALLKLRKEVKAL